MVVMMTVRTEDNKVFRVIGAPRRGRLAMMEVQLGVPADLRAACEA
jgi:hypothetical protein